MAVDKVGLTSTEEATLERLWTLTQGGDHYEILGVEDTAERSDIQQAYYTLSRQWHPDRFFRVDLGEQGERLEAVFIAITEAYRTLSNDSARRAYDVQRESTHGRRRRSKNSPVALFGAVVRRAQAAIESDAERAPRRSSLREGRAAGRRRRSGASDTRRKRRVEPAGTARSPA